MKIKVRVTPNAKINKISKEGDFFKIKVTAKAEKGKANQAVVNLIAATYSLKKSQISIIQGEKSRDKIIEIEGIQGLPKEQISLKI